MHVVNPMFHMDKDYNWRWFVINDHGQQLSMSSRVFFRFEDARRNYDEVHRLLTRRVS